MTGLIFLAAVIGVVWACVWVAKTLGNQATTPRKRSVVKWLVLLVLLSLPFIDEVIGKYQFEALCKANGIESVDVSKARGKSVKVEYGKREYIDGTVIPIRESDVFFKDSVNGDTLIQHKNYYAEGGWLMRYTWVSMGSNHPMLFDGNGCDQHPIAQIFARNSITFLHK